uniref:Uncharacterized protein AlNc14C164G7850 n=1 Tax=Albugo laibachii Nc14 TaxID=890382 RepID=F0WN18_9STRA|nr:conserved hypothetical protein [Albugo laibachii Nc14]|eukprot:CCA22705.1 conserved hypothetical protein [Albugo laibachii Nc14]
MAKAGEIFVLCVLFMTPCCCILYACVCTKTFFAIHPALNSISQLLLAPMALFAMSEKKKSSSHMRRVRLTKIHFACQLLAFTCMLAGGIVIYMNKQMTQKQHFTSLHSWVAVLSFGLYTLSLLRGIMRTVCAGRIVKWLWRDTYHRVGGFGGSVLGAMSAVLGLYSGMWGLNHFGDQNRFNLALMIVLGYLFLLGRTLVADQNAHRNTS